ncbi:LysR family transcriptional regulator [Paraglaciecola aquimarina]|uniref:LysR family transcriptional regulator n=1 Tax=Paraglaciecola algarum TaxID=3050085 RepID=A0ABS9DD20_9ALTE|nr:LysR family transcriptional regulator [Paraglaciecola sp. G1-23]MCF2950252.1 LysR family transcriptional regulator [Paraglaciecola sp. G1-23]
MNANDLILFSQVVELGSFSKVADVNNLTNSVVSKRIARLEKELGVQLLYRTTRKLTLTEAGKILIQRAKLVSQATTEAMQSVSGFGESLTGHIKMSVPTISGDLLLADAVTEFCHSQPGLTVDMSLDNRMVDLIGEGYDIVIRTGYLDDSSLIARHIIDSQWVVCASLAYINEYGRPANPTDLVKHNCLRYAYQTRGASEWEFKENNQNYLVKVSGAFSTNNAAALRKAALGGYGIAYVPRCLVYHDLQDAKLIDLFPQSVAKRLGVYAVYPYTKQLPYKINLLIEHIRDRYLAHSQYFLTPEDSV